MKKQILIALLFLSFGIQAECVEKLLNGYTLDSQSFSFYNDDVAEMLDQTPERGAKQAVEALKSQLHCEKNDLTTEVKSVSCQEIQPGKFFSLNCYVETTYGYFFVSKDMMEKVNLIYNRFD